MLILPELKILTPISIAEVASSSAFMSASYTRIQQFFLLINQAVSGNSIKAWVNKTVIRIM